MIVGLWLSFVVLMSVGTGEEKRTEKEEKEEKEKTVTIQ